MHQIGYVDGLTSVETEDVKCVYGRNFGGRGTKSKERNGEDAFNIFLRGRGCCLEFTRLESGTQPPLAAASCRQPCCPVMAFMA